MTYRNWALSAVIAAAAALAGPAVASAATGTLNQPCYTHIPTRSSQPIVISLTGGTPGADYEVAATVPGKGLGSAGSADGTFDAAGNAIAQITDVSPPSGTIDPTKGQAVSISVQDFGVEGAPPVTIGTALITTLSMSVSDKPSNPHARRLIRISGAPFAHRRLYGFITKLHGSHVLKRIAIGRGDVCGFAKTKAVVAPPSFKAGNYRFYINAGKKLNKKFALSTSFEIFRKVL